MIFTIESAAPNAYRLIREGLSKPHSTVLIVGESNIDCGGEALKMAVGCILDGGRWTGYFLNFAGYRPTEWNQLLNLRDGSARRSKVDE